MSKHTPGPWIAFETEVYFAKGAGGLSVRGCPDAEANARLIASAPELLEALEIVLDSCEFAIDDMTGAYYLDRADATKARAAIAKAKGESA